jgi:hypothetical protein
MKINWLTASTLFIYALIFSEIFIRVMEPQALMPRYVTAGTDGIRKNIPNAVYNHKTPEITVEMRINSQGIRSDRDFSLKKPADIYRIVLLGDSFFMGYEVDLEDSIASLLEKNMISQGVNAEVVNLAVSGFGTAENLIALRERASLYQPDLIVMQWHDTDDEDNIRSNLFSVEDGHLREKNPHYLPGIQTRDKLMKMPGYEWLINNSHLYSIVRKKLSARIKKLLLKQRKPSNTKEISQVKTGQRRDLDKLDELLILAVKTEAEQQGSELVLFDVPRRVSRTEFNSSFSKLDLVQLGDTVLISPIDLFTSKSSEDIKLYTEKGHGHWTELGNRLAASLLTEKVLDIYRAKITVDLGHH